MDFGFRVYHGIEDKLSYFRADVAKSSATDCIQGLLSEIDSSSLAARHQPPPEHNI